MQTRTQINTNTHNIYYHVIHTQISTAMDRHALLDDDMRTLDVKQYSAESDLKSAVEEAATRGLTTVAVDLFDHGCRKKMVCPNAPNKGAVALSSIVELLERNHIADHTVSTHELLQSIYRI